MYSDLDLYYLNLMGIRPWLDKKNLAANEGALNKYKLLILSLPELAPKERTLLEQILSFLELKPECFKQFKMESAQNIPTDLALGAECILSFGDASHYQLTGIQETHSLTELINKPVLKKKLFQLLVALKAQLAA